MAERLFLGMPRGCLRFVIVVFPDHSHLLFLIPALVFKNSALDGSNEKIFCRHQNVKFDLSTQVDFW